MPVVIKEMRIRTVVEKRIVTETEVSDEIIRKIESHVLDRLSEENLTGQPAGRRAGCHQRFHRLAAHWRPGPAAAHGQAVCFPAGKDG